MLNPRVCLPTSPMDTPPLHQLNYPPPMHQLLQNLKVLDLTHYVAGPHCTKLLADYGADVLKVEKPRTGDPARRLSPFLNDTPRPDNSGLFLNLNTNKRSVTANLKSEHGRRLIKQLVRWADILVESFRPGTMARIGLSPDSLSGINPSLLLVSISNFGQTGPYRDYSLDEITGYAMGGMMHANGLPEREPLKLGGRVGLYQAGVVAAGAAITALHGARAAGRADHVDVSIFETQAASIDRRANWILAYQYTGENAFRLGPTLYSAQRPTKDGYIEMWTVGAMLPRLANALGIDIHHPERQADLIEELEARVLEWSLSHTKQEIWFKAQEQRIPSGPLNYIDEVLADPQFRAIGFWDNAEHPHTGNVRLPGSPFFPHNAPRQLRRPAPTLGQHNQEVFSGLLGLSTSEISRLAKLEVI